MRNAGRIGVSLRRSLTLAGLLCVQGFVVGCSEAEKLISDAKGLTKVTEAASVEGRKEGVWQPPAGHQQQPLWPRAAPQMEQFKRPSENRQSTTKTKHFAVRKGRYTKEMCQS